MIKSFYFYNEKQIGGIEGFIDLLIEKNPDIKHINYFSRSGEKSIFNKNIEVNEMSIFSKIWYFLKLRRYLNLEKNNTLLIHDPFTLIMLNKKTIKRNKIIYYQHGSWDALFKLLPFFLRRRYAKKISQVKKVSCFTEDDILDLMNKVKIDRTKIISAFVLNKGILNTTKNSEKSDSNIIVFIGRIHYYSKRIDSILEWFRNNSNGFELHIYGKGIDLNRLKNDIKDDNNIIYKGFTDKPIEVLKKSKYSILLSRREGQPLLIFESALANTPVLTNKGITPAIDWEISKGAGVFINEFKNSNYEMYINNLSSFLQNIDFNSEISKTIQTIKEVDAEIIKK